MKKKLYYLYSVLVSIFCFSVVNIEFQNDTFSAIKIGEYILKNGIDFKEHFNFNDNLVYHNARWLFNVFVGFIYDHFNFIGLYIFVIILSIILGLIIFNCLYKNNKNLFLSLILTIFTISLGDCFIVGRAQLVSYIFFFLELFFIERLLSENKLRYSIFIVLCSIGIANFHTTVWPITIVLFLPYFAEYILYKFKFIKNSKRFYSNINSNKLLFITFIITILSGLCTPLSLLPYTYMYKTISGLSTTFILELTPINMFFEYRLLILFIIYIILMVYMRNKIKISDLFLVLGLFILSLFAYRNLSFFIFLCSISLSRLLVDSYDIISDKTKKILEFINKDKFILIGSTLIVVICVSTFRFATNIYNNNFVDEKSYPVEASNYILENLDVENIRLFNEFNYGSYLEFRGIKVFLDSRSEVYCPEFNNTTILQDYYDVYYFKTDYKSVFSRYDFTHLIINGKHPLNRYLAYDIDYRIIYSDDNFNIYEKVE